MLTILHLDDGGKDRSKRGKGGTFAFAVGGYLATATDWTALEDRWLPILAEKGIHRFHMTDCRAGEGEFVTMPNIRERLAWFARLCGLIHTFTEYGVAYGFGVDHFHGVLDPSRLAWGSPVAKVRPLAIAIVAVLMQVFEKYEHAPLDEKIAVVFARGTDGLGMASDFIHWLMDQGSGG